MIFNESADIASSQRSVPNQLPVLPACEALRGTNPKRPVAGDEQAADVTGRQMLIRGRLPRNSPDAIETQQADLRAQPEIAVRRLCN